MFKHPIFQNYTMGDASWEIILMLLGAFILGWLLSCLWAAMTRGGAGRGAIVDNKLYAPDDLTVVEGIGPKINELLNAAGIMTWRQLSDTDTGTLKGILERAGKRFQIHDPASWPEQARLAAEGSWDKFEEYKEFLVAGRE